MTLLSDGAAALLAGRITDVADYPKPGILFKDIGPLLADARAFAVAVDALVAPHRGGPTEDSATTGTGDEPGGGRIDKVVGIEARGFVLAAPVAYHLGAGFVPVRKKGKLPGRTLAASYSLEYAEATLELSADSIVPGDRVLVVDDVLATGGTVEAALGLLERARAHVVGVSVLLELSGLGGRARLAGTPVRALLAT